MVENLIISVDDGRKGVLQVADMLERFNLKGTFYIAPFERGMDLTRNEILELSKKHRIGGHTLTHQRLTDCSLDKAKYEIEEGKKELENIIGRTITTHATPRGWQNEAIVRLIKEAGFMENRNTKMGITDITGCSPFDLPCSAHLYPRPEYQGVGIKNSVLRKFKEAKVGGYFNLLIHSNELYKYELWGSLNEILREISHYENFNTKPL